MWGPVMDRRPNFVTAITRMTGLSGGEHARRQGGGAPGYRAPQMLVVPPFSLLVRPNICKLWKKA